MRETTEMLYTSKTALCCGAAIANKKPLREFNCPRQIHTHVEHLQHKFNCPRERHKQRHAETLRWRHTDTQAAQNTVSQTRKPNKHSSPTNKVHKYSIGHGQRAWSESLKTKQKC